MNARKTVLILALWLVPGMALEAVAQEEKEWGYNKGFFLRTPGFEMKISTRTQFRFTHTLFDDLSASEDRGEFTLPRTRLRLDGHAYYPWIRYKVQYDFTGQTHTTATSVTVPDDGAGADTVSLSNARGADLRDLYFDFTRSPWASVRLGQFKAPLGIQEMTSSGDQEFVDRSIASEAFAPSRQQGAMLFGVNFDKSFGYEVGLFNGNARNKFSNDNDGYMYVARIHFDPNGEYKLSETAVDNPDKINYTFGAAFLQNATDAAGELNDTTIEGFFALKYRRLFVLADYYQRAEEEAAGPDTDADGYVAQVGCFLVPGKIETSLRYSEFDPDTDTDGDEREETRIGLGWFFSKHDLKFQADYGRVRNEASATDRDTGSFRAQLQIVF
jgi:hypothetical protein